ncbi:hypothetical protein FRC00_003969, partial [Tulasnella sp. 408]
LPSLEVEADETAESPSKKRRSSARLLATKEAGLSSTQTTSYSSAIPVTKSKPSKKQSTPRKGQEKRNIKSSAARRPARQHSQSAASPSAEDIKSLRKVKTVPDPPSTPGGRGKTRPTANSSSLTAAPITSQAGSSRTSGSTATTAIGINPGAAESCSDVAAGHIDFGRLVPEGRANKGDTIWLQLPDDGRQTCALRVGKGKQCDITLQDKDIGEVHCNLELDLQCNYSTYRRVVRVRTNGSHGILIIPGNGGTAQPQSILQDGWVVQFGPKKKHRYLYVSPKSPLPTSLCWLERTFYWDSEMKPNFGGRRRNASVFLVRKRNVNSRHALKVTETARFHLRPLLEEMVRREREALTILSHPQVLKLEVFKHDAIHGRCVLVFPEMEGGNLFDFVVGHRAGGNQDFLNGIAHKLAKDLLSGLRHNRFKRQYIHSEGISHRDLKPENLLLPTSLFNAASFTIVVGDFGLASLPGETRTKTFDGGSTHWFSPLFMRDPTVPDYLMDYWGAALVIWFVLAGIPKPWGKAGSPVSVIEPNQLKWGWLEKLRISDDFESLDHCGTLEDAETHPWIRHGHTIKPIADGDAIATSAIEDTDSVSDESSGYGFDDKYPAAAGDVEAAPF